MNDSIRDKCEMCEFSGYSHYLCRMHMKRMAREKHTKKESGKASPIRRIGVRAAVGAGVGAAAVAGGMALVPAAVLKTFLGHMAVVKVLGGGAGAGAGINVFRRAGGEKAVSKKERGKRRFFFSPSSMGRDLSSGGPEKMQSGRGSSVAAL